MSELIAFLEHNKRVIFKRQQLNNNLQPLNNTCPIRFEPILNTGQFRIRYCKYSGFRLLSVDFRMSIIIYFNNILQI